MLTAVSDCTMYAKCKTIKLCELKNSLYKNYVRLTKGAVLIRNNIDVFLAIIITIIILYTS